MSLKQLGLEDDFLYIDFPFLIDIVEGYWQVAELLVSFSCHFQQDLFDIISSERRRDELREAKVPQQ